MIASWGDIATPRLCGPTCFHDDWPVDRRCDVRSWHGNLYPGPWNEQQFFAPEKWMVKEYGLVSDCLGLKILKAYFCSWCKLLVSGKGISRSSGPQMFRFHVFGVFMEVIYEMMEGRNFYHQAEAKRLPDHPNTDSGRHQPAALTSRTKKHPLKF